MNEVIHIRHPFLTVEGFRQRAGSKLAGLIHRLVGKYPQLRESCGMQRMLLALSVAWGMSDMAQAGNLAAFEHIDEALQPYHRLGYIAEPPGGCVVVAGQPFLIAEEEQGMRRFLWDGFAIFIEQEGTDHIAQAFFDLADSHQWKAYAVMGEAHQEEMKRARQEETSKPRQEETSKTRLEQENHQQLTNQEREKEREKEASEKSESTEIPEVSTEPTELSPSTNKPKLLSKPEKTLNTGKTKKENSKETNIGNKNNIKNNVRNNVRNNNNEKKDIERLGAADVEETPKTDVEETSETDIEQAEAVDGLAEFLDSMLCGNYSIEDLEDFATKLDRCSVEATGEAHLIITEQARRLHYQIERKRQSAIADELKRKQEQAKMQAQEQAKMQAQMQAHEQAQVQAMVQALQQKIKQLEQLEQLIIQKGTITMGDSYTISVQGDYVHGDKVMGNKYVGAACQQGEQEEHIKNALSILMDEKTADGKPLFQTQGQWFAVYRILCDEYDWKDGALSEFCRRIKDLGVEWRVPCKLEGIKKMNQTSPFYKPFSEWTPQGNRTTYDRLQQVALRFQQLMQEEKG